MSKTNTGGGPRGVTDWLSLAAAPSFAIMALLTGFLDGHSPPWLKLISGQRCAAASARRCNGHQVCP